MQSDGEGGNSNTPHNKVFIPKHPLSFSEDRLLTVFEISDRFKRIPLMTYPSYFLSLTSAFIMMDAFASLSLVKGFVFSLPFVSILAVSTYLTQ
jgi:hypothetical protein